MATLQEYIRKLSNEQLVQLLIDDCEGRSDLPSETVILISKTLDERSTYTPTEEDRHIFRRIYLKEKENFPPPYTP